MGLFNKFTDTVILKNDCELELQIDALKKLLKKYPNNEKLKHKLKICELGLIGENEIKFELENSNIGMYVLRDINLKYGEMSAQIDYIIVTSGYFYFVECKNLIGNILVNDRGEFIREYNYNNRKIKEGVYSPIRQAERHIDIFTKMLDERRSNSLLYKLRREFCEEAYKSWYKPLVVFANSKNILNVKYAPKEIKEKIVKSDSLVEYIKRDIQKIDKDLLSNQERMYKNAINIMENYNEKIDRDYEKEFLKLVEEEASNDKTTNNDEKLKEELILFRKNRAKEKNIPPYYVFNNDELNELIKNKPKTIEELRSLKILVDIKVISHGKEIVKIIQKNS